MLARTEKILLVDDMKTMLFIVKQTVEQLGYRNLETAKDGKTAWAFLESCVEFNQMPGLIISDWTMPEMDGLELLKRVRADEKLKNIPFLLLTGKSELLDVQTAIKERVSGYLTKPFAPNDLLATMEKIFKAR